MSLALLGGSFDPVHRGHLQSAQELVAQLDCAQLALLPAAHSPLKDGHCASAEQRLAMLQLGLAEVGNCGGKITVDRRELDRSGRSYTIDTVREVRAAIGAERPLYWVIGSDSASHLERWRQWQHLLRYCHLVILSRAEQPLQCTPTIQAWLERHQCYKLAQLQATAAGAVWHCTLSPLPISSTAVRQQIASGAPLTGWLPTSVAEYIATHSLYR